ncbi:hypothetical protein C0989_009307 [Termitomyces sp. Mn162]|nr:hypothetical protein C0989_009307 [Termitomyces sp. Mn162]
MAPWPTPTSSSQLLALPLDFLSPWDHSPTVPDPINSTPWLPRLILEYHDSLGTDRVAIDPINISMWPAL